jgi:membrane-bound ClpP family serine protease
VLPLDEYIKKQLDEHVESLEALLNGDFMAIVSPILPGIDRTVRHAIELKQNKRSNLTILLDTQGGIVEVVARMVDTTRFHYDAVDFMVLDRAMSAGTVFVMSGNRIFMDYFSCLGPIDPQIEKDGRLVPALSYLNQFNKLNQKAAEGNLTSAEFALIRMIDPGELDQFEEARNLYIELLKKWLSKYKFKTWERTEQRNIPVTSEMKEQRAEEIASKLSDSQRWHSHGIGINMAVLRNELSLKIEDLADTPKLHVKARQYFDLLRDYMMRQKLGSFVHTKEFF